LNYDIFISYRRDDTKKTAIILQEKLSDHYNTFIDEKGIGKGEVWPNELEKTLKEVSILIVLIGVNWELKRLHHQKDWVLREINTAIDEKKHIIPVLVDEAQMPNKNASSISSNQNTKLLF